MEKKKRRIETESKQNTYKCFGLSIKINLQSSLEVTLRRSSLGADGWTKVTKKTWKLFNGRTFTHYSFQEMNRVPIILLCGHYKNPKRRFMVVFTPTKVMFIVSNHNGRGRHDSLFPTTHHTSAFHLLSLHQSIYCFQFVLPT